MSNYKTNVMRILDKEKISYKAYSYDTGSDFIDGVSAAEKLDIPVEKMYKTLVAQGISKEYYVFVIPVAKELDLKAAARAVGEKSIALIHVKDINKVTGYIRGGCSPIGMKKQYKTVIDAASKQVETIVISAGKIGYQIELKPEELCRLVGCKTENIIL